MEFTGFEGIFGLGTKKATDKTTFKKNSLESDDSNYNDNFRKLSAEIASTYSDSMMDEAKERGKAMAEGFYQNLLVMDSMYGGSLFKASAAVAQYDIPVALQSKNDYMKLGAYAVGGDAAVAKLNKRSFEVGYHVMTKLIDNLEVAKGLKKTSTEEVEVDLVNLLRGSELYKVSSGADPDEEVSYVDDCFDLVKALRDKKWVKRSMIITPKKNSQEEEEFEVTITDPVEVGTLESALETGSSVVDTMTETAGEIAGAEAGEAAAETASATMKEETGQEMSLVDKKKVAENVKEEVKETIKEVVEEAAAEAVKDLSKTSSNTSKDKKVTEDELKQLFENFDF